MHNRLVSIRKYYTQGPNPVILIDLTWEFGEKTIGGGKFGPNMELN